MEIYIVTSGEYSEYGIDAVFTDRENADAYVKLANDKTVYARHRVEVWETDQVLPKVYYGVGLGFTLTAARKIADETVLNELGTCLSSVMLETNVRKVNGKYVGTAWSETYEAAKKNLWDAIAKAKAEEAGL